MKNGRPQAKDIKDGDALAAVLKCMDHPAMPAHKQPAWHGPASRWDIAKELGFPGKVVLAKMRALERRGLVGGPGCCTCGCRGDFELTKQGEAVLVGPNSIAKELEAVMHLAKDLYPSESPK